MGLFLEAAKQWNKLSNTSYYISMGYKKKLKTINLTFRDIDFDHLSGIHYAKDVDFKLHRKEYRGNKLISALLSQKLDDSLVEKSSNWAKISDRLYSILDISKILESDFAIYKFASHKLPFYSNISATYLIYSENYRAGIFLFLDIDNEVYYCKSIFGKDIRDYRLNQTSVTILQTKMIVDGIEETLYTHPSYREESFYTETT